MSRITLITYFDEKQLDIISKFLKNINFKMCKVPYGINDNKRYEIDNLPYHFTIFATDKINQDKLLNITKNIKMDKIKLKVNKVTIGNLKNDSFILYFGIEDNYFMKNLQRNFYEIIPEEKYNPDNFNFHMTLHIDKNFNIVNNLFEMIQLEFKPFYIEFNKLALYDYPGEMIETIELKK